MPAIIRTAAAAKPAARKYFNPVQRGLEYSLLGDADSPGTNFALGKPDALIVGTPVRGADAFSWRFTGLANYLQTEMLDTDAQTFIAVCRTFSLGSPDYISTAFGIPTLEDTSTNTWGSRFRAGSGSLLTWGAGRGTSTSDDVDASANITGVLDEYAIYILQTGAQNKISSDTGGTTATSAVTAPRFPTRNQFRIGSGFTNGGGAESDFALVRGWSVDLTTDEISAEVADVRTYMAGLGVTV